MNRVRVVLLLLVMPLAVTGQVPTAEQLQAAKDAFARFGAQYQSIKTPPPQGVTHWFRLPSTVTDAELKGLPNPPFPFALDLSETRVTGPGLKELKGLKNLTTLELALARETDAALTSLREIGMLHVLNRARSKGAARPVSSEEVVTLDLFGAPVTNAGLKELTPLKNLTLLDLRETRVTVAGLKHLKDFKSLTTLRLSTPLTDAALATLREIGLLHALDRALAKNDVRPTSAAEIVTLDLSGTRVTAEGLKELKGLKSLVTLKLAPLQVTDAALARLREIGLLHALSLARGKDGGRPATPAEVLSLDLSDTPVTGGGLKELKELKNLSSLHLSEPRVTDTTLVNLREIGLLHALSLARGKNDALPASPAEVISLFLGGTPVTAAGLKELRDFKNLTSLSLSTAQVTDVALTNLREIGLLHALIQAGGKDDARPASPAEVLSLNLVETKVTDEGLKELRDFKNLTKLHLGNTQMSDAGLAHLREIGLLHSLSQARAKDGGRPSSPAEVSYLILDSTPVTNVSLKEFKDFKNLTTLDLSNTAVTGEGLKEFKEFRNLTTLSLRKTHIVDADLRELNEFKNLTALHLNGTKITGAGLKELKDLKKLNALDLDVVNDATLASLREIGLLHALNRVGTKGDLDSRPASSADAIRLNLNGTQVTDMGLKELKDLKNLIYLNLTGTEVTGAGLKELGDLKHLTTLVLDRPGLTDEGLTNLREIGLLHALEQASGKGDARPGSPSEVVSLTLIDTRVTGAGLKQLRDLKNLATLHLRDTEVADNTLASLREVGLLHSLWQVKARGETRAASAAEVVTIFLDRTKVTGAGLKELRDFKNLTLLNLNDTQVTDVALIHLREIGLLHAMSQASGRRDDIRPSSTPEVLRLNLYNTTVTDEGLKQLKELKNLTTLNLSGTRVTDAGLKELKDLKALTSVYLGQTKVTNTTLSNLREIGLLHALHLAKGKGDTRPASAEEVLALELSGTQVTDVGLKQLKDFKNLARLNLDRTGVTDAGLKELNNLRNLTTLTLHTTRVTSAGLQELKDLQKLNLLVLSDAMLTDATLANLHEMGLLHALHRTNGKGSDRPASPAEVFGLNLDGAQVTDVSLKLLKEFRNLTSLHLSSTRVTDEGLKELKELKNLSYLDLRGTRVTNEGMKHLKGLKNLTTLYLSDTRVTAAGVKELREALPSLRPQ